MTNNSLVSAFIRYRIAQSEVDRWGELRNNELLCLRQASLEEIVTTFNKIESVVIIRDTRNVSLSEALKIYETAIVDSRKDA